MALSQQLKSEIEAFYHEKMQGHDFFVKARSGNLNAKHVEILLAQLYAVVSKTQSMLRFAIDVCEKRGLHELAEFYKLKVKEEVGHDQWAIEDLRALRGQGAQFADQPAQESAVAKMLEMHRELIDRDPALYLPYILFAEYYTVIATNETLDLLENRCGIPRSCFSVLSNHQELDQDHVDEWQDSIDSLIDTGRYEKPFHDVLQKTFGLYQDVMSEVSHGA